MSFHTGWVIRAIPACPVCPESGHVWAIYEVWQVRRDEYEQDSAAAARGGDRGIHCRDTEATMHAMAAEILRYRHAMIQVADAVAWAQAGAAIRNARSWPALAATRHV